MVQTISNYDAFIARFTDNAQANYRSLAFFKDSLSKAENSDVIIYPNPANNLLNVESNKGLSGMLTIYNILGKPVKSLTVSGSKITIPVEDLPSGLYILKVNDNKIRFTIVK